MEKNEEIVQLIVREVRKVLEKRIPSVKKSLEYASEAAQPDESIFRIDQKVLTLKHLMGVESTVKRIAVHKNAVITPLAGDYIAETGIEIVWMEGTAPEKKGMTVGLISSEGDNQVFRDVKRILDIKKVPWQDYNSEAAAGDSYNINLGRLVEAVLKNNVRFGICIDETGIEAPLLANRTEGIRAVFCPDAETARIARKSFDANILVFTKRGFAHEIAEDILTSWLS